jgi:hypothetical protein
MRRRKADALMEVKAPPPEGRQLEDLVRMRAFELYLERGCGPGKELEDWVRAEREVCARLGVGPCDHEAGGY